ncbi:putative F-box-like domain superfamily protein [Helianthus anomalus]
MESSESAEIVLSMDDLLCKILVGLPLASLRLFKSVWKRWFSLITDPSFNALHTRTPNADHPKGLLFQLQSSSSVLVYVPFQFKQLDAPPPTRLIRFAYATNSQRYMAVWQSCNGLLLCNDRPDKLYVYNPTINQCKLLPMPHVWVPNRSSP